MLKGPEMVMLGNKCIAKAQIMTNSPFKDAELWRISWFQPQDKELFKTNADLPKDADVIGSLAKLGTVGKMVMDCNTMIKKGNAEYTMLLKKKAWKVLSQSKKFQLIDVKGMLKC